VRGRYAPSPGERAPGKGENASSERGKSSLSFLPQEVKEERGQSAILAPRRGRGAHFFSILEKGASFAKEGPVKPFRSHSTQGRGLSPLSPAPKKREETTMYMAGPALHWEGKGGGGELPEKRYVAFLAARRKRSGDHTPKR